MALKRAQPLVAARLFQDRYRQRPNVGARFTHCSSHFERHGNKRGSGLVTGRALAVLTVLALVAAACSGDPETGATSAPTPSPTTTPDPWALPDPPPEGIYDGPLFTLSHQYPAEPVPAPDPAPWREAIDNGQITVGNAGNYVEALKDYIASDMQQLLFDYADWDAGEAGWYNMPWLESVREPIHGTYVGSSFEAGMFPQSGLEGHMTTHVLVYYDEVAAASLQNVWGTSGMDPVSGIEAGGAQFPEGSIVVKPAFTTANGSLWPPMEGAYQWDIYARPEAHPQGDPELQEVSLFQFDIIVKDSQSAPQTQWVFSTLVYDKDAPGDDWDKLVPLGAMWGNDPDVDSPETCDYLASPDDPNACPALEQTWINPDAPLYSRETLGWGGRLSGPNDGSVDIDAAVQTNGGSEPFEGRYAMSSCMSCHGPAEYPTESFLLPVRSTCQDDQCRPETDADGRLVYLRAGSDEFMRWFQNRPGDVPQDEGTTALDYDMNYAFKAIPAWFGTTDQQGDLKFIEEFNDYRGLGTSVLEQRR